MEELYDKESTTLVLRAITATNPTGAINFATANAKNTQVTWNNVNLSQALGTLYNKYNTFNLILKTVVIPAGSVNIASTNDYIISYYLTGLNIKNGTYDYSFGSQTSRAYLGTTQLASSTAAPNSASVTYTALMPITFTKAELANLTIYIKGIDGNDVGSTLPAGFTFVFQIVGVS